MADKLKLAIKFPDETHLDTMPPETVAITTQGRIKYKNAMGEIIDATAGGIKDNNEFYIYSLKAEEDNQTVFTLPIDSTFENLRDSLLIIQNTITDSKVSTNLTYTVDTNGFTLSKGVKLGTCLNAIIYKNTKLMTAGTVITFNSPEFDRMKSELINLKIQLAEEGAITLINRKSGVGYYDLFTDTSGIDIVNTTATLVEGTIVFTGNQNISLLEQDFTQVNNIELDVYDSIEDRNYITPMANVIASNTIEASLPIGKYNIGDTLYHNGEIYTITGLS